MTTRRLRFTALWAVAVGIAVAGGTSAVALADNHGISPKPLDQHQVARQLADARPAPNAKPAKPARPGKPSATPSPSADPTVVTTRGGSETLICGGDSLWLGAVSQNVGWHVHLAALPEDPSQVVTTFSPTNGGSSIKVAAHCEAGQPKWTIS